MNSISCLVTVESPGLGAEDFQWKGVWEEITTPKASAVCTRPGLHLKSVDAAPKQEGLERKEAWADMPDDWEEVVPRRRKRTTRQATRFQQEAQSPCHCCLLETIGGNDQINTVSEEWEELCLAVDSGATETVVSANDVPNIPVEEGAASKAGVKYAMANGEAIENEGEKLMLVNFAEGVERYLTAQVTDVSKPLLSVSQMVKAGNTVVFSPQGSWIYEEESGEFMEMEESKGMYMLRVWARKPFS